MSVLGECFWHPGQPFTMEAPLCDTDGIVRGGQFHSGTDYPCTGGAHFAGEHIRCNSPAHAQGDALPDRPERVDEPLPEDLERLLRDPEIATAFDRGVHEALREHLRRDPEAAATREMYLNLWALFDLETGR